MRNNTTYLGILNHDQRRKLDSIIQTTNFFQYDSSYTETSVTDGTAYEFFIARDSISKHIIIYGDNAPIELLNLAAWIAEAKRAARLTPIDTVIPFQYRESFPTMKNFVRPSI